MVTSQAELAARVARATAASQELGEKTARMLVSERTKLAFERTEGELSPRFCAEGRERLLRSRRDLETAKRLLAELAAL
jgi:hypothetical protein